MEYLTITGGSALRGEVRVSGAKNAMLPLFFATLLSTGHSVLRNVPDLEDTRVSIRLLRNLGASVTFKNNVLTISAEKLTSTEAPYSQVKALRASFWSLGPLLAREGYARVALPGGDAIGTRPVDLHLHGLQCLGASFNLQHGVVVGSAPGGLKGAEINLQFPSVGATHNILMAATLAEGETILHGAACEPEVVELAGFLNSMGAKIEGAGESCIRIAGVSSLGDSTWSVLGDRIEAATYLCAAAVTGGSIKVTGIDPVIVAPTLKALTEMGCLIEVGEASVSLKGPKRLKAISIDTAPHPGLATDVQPLLMAILTTAEGTSSITENVFENRFGHVSEYRRLGASILVDGRNAQVAGVEKLSAAPVEGLDIRAAAGLVLMGLVAEGETEVTDIFHLDRGYDGMVEKLRALGAAVKRVRYFGERELVVGC